MKNQIGKSLPQRNSTKFDAFQNCCNFDISISTMFPANNSFHRAAVLAHPECMSRVKYASPIYTRISARAISRSLTKQKFMDSVEFSSPFHRLVEHARRRRGRCNSYSNFTSKPATESKLKFVMASLYRPAAQSYAGPMQKTKTYCIVERSFQQLKKKLPARRTYCRRHANERAPPSSMTFIVEIRSRDSDKRAWMNALRPLFESSLSQVARKERVECRACRKNPTRYLWFNPLAKPVPSLKISFLIRSKIGLNRNSDIFTIVINSFFTFSS